MGDLQKSLQEKGTPRIPSPPGSDRSLFQRIYTPKAALPASPRSCCEVFAIAVHAFDRRGRCCCRWSICSIFRDLRRAIPVVRTIQQSYPQFLRRRLEPAGERLEQRFAPVFRPRVLKPPGLICPFEFLRTRVRFAIRSRSASPTKPQSLTPFRCADAGDNSPAHTATTPRSPLGLCIEYVRPSPSSTACLPVYSCHRRDNTVGVLRIDLHQSCLPAAALRSRSASNPSPRRGPPRCRRPCCC